MIPGYLAQVQKGIDYIEEHLDFEIETSSVARHAGVSHWHFQRIFKALTHETLKSYIRTRRLTNALRKLERGEERVLDIAITAGFESQESFTRAFKAAFGVTPAAYRRSKLSIPAPAKARIDAEYLEHLHNGISLEPEIYTQRQLCLVGLATCFFGADSEKNNMADKIPGLWSDFLERLPEIPKTVAGTCYGVVRQTPARTDELEYLAGIEVDAELAPPPGMTKIVVPSARYAKFTHRGRMHLLDQTVNYIYSNWLARSKLRHTYAADLEFYGAGFQLDSDESVMYYAIPVHDAG